MKHSVATVIGVAVSLAVLSPELASAGPYSDALAMCLVRSTTDDDKNYLVKWMFAAAALHPAVKPIASVTEQQRVELTKGAAKLFERLVGDSCRSETQEALRYEGPGTLQASFQVLGQVAARGLFSDPDVARGMADLGKYVDNKKLEGLFSPTQ